MATGKVIPEKTTWERLAEPFEPQDLEWRIQDGGIKNNKPWARVVVYITSRGIQERLDLVLGPEQWQTRMIPDTAGVICELGIKCGDEWIWKADGSPYTDIMGYKGGASGALKRAAVHFGIGRYLYGLKAGWATFVSEHQGIYRNKLKANKNDKDGKWFDWNPPELPQWALPVHLQNKKPASPEPGQPEQGQPKADSPPTNLDWLLKQLEACTTSTAVGEFSAKYKNSINDLPPDEKQKIVKRGLELRASLPGGAA